MPLNPSPRHPADVTKMGDWSTSLLGCIDNDPEKGKFFLFQCLFGSFCCCLAEGDVAKLVGADYNTACIGACCPVCSVFLCWTPNRIAYIQQRGINDQSPPLIHYAITCLISPCSTAQILTHENFKSAGGVAKAVAAPVQHKM